MSKIILQPSSNKGARDNYVDTIKNSVSLEVVKPFVTEDEFKLLKEIYPNEECMIWGVTPGGNNVTKWNRIAKGDITLFSKNKAIYASAVTTYKLQNSSLASRLWGYDNKKQTWEYIYFLDEIKNHNIPYIDFNRAVGYDDKYVIQGFNVLTPEQSVRLIKTFDLESEIFIEDLAEDVFEDVVLKLETLEKTEAEIVSYRRLEQGYLKQKLFGRKTIGICAGCKKEFPVSYLITAHIKKRASCEHSERTDLNIVMPLCKMGCDEIYEKGYISVSEGAYVDMKKSPITKWLQDYIDQIVGTICEYYSDKTKKYFDWHYEQNK
ncbi:HNH endonuclease [Flavobacterium sp. 2]|uniref:HNH endonuclease n=1 Tax=Flavobacterium sp. 2 TaxID=308053 RepID=UPI000C193B18|nr:HNH endonuclease [Flavobacterium sp. 2]PIF69453.1 hypothetical protein CLU99_0158 [Flavobacterium sp. 2]